jgi:hypothetical protein
VPKHMLSARQVQGARRRQGDTHDGEGLILRVQKKAASWPLQYRVASGKRREPGLGAVDRSSIQAAGASLTGARELADEARNQLKRCKSRSRSADLQHSRRDVSNPAALAFDMQPVRCGLDS